MLQLNKNMLDQLPKLLDIRVIDFTDTVFGVGRKHMWNQLKNSGWSKLTCKDLVRIVNAYHVPLSRFLSDKEVSINPSVSGPWTPVIFHPERICEEYRKANPKFHLKDFADAMQTTSSCLYRWFVPGATCSMTVEQALLMTYNLDLPLSFLFTDNNEVLPYHMRLDTAIGSERTLLELQELRSTVRALQSRITALLEEQKRLKDQLPLMVSEDAPSIGDYATRIRPFIFNQGLWDNLHVVFNVSKREIERRTHCKMSVSCPSVKQLVDTCNALRINISHFLLRSVIVPQLYNSDYYHASSYSPVVFNPLRLNHIFGVGNILNKKRKDIIEVLDVSDMITRRWCRPESTLDVCQLVDMCNALDITPAICLDNDGESIYSYTLTELLVEENMLLRERLSEQDE